MNTPEDFRRLTIHAELMASHKEFHSMIDGFAETDFRRHSRNPGWTNGEIIAHMVFGFTITTDFIPLMRWWAYLPKASSKPFAIFLDALTGPFNWFNALGARTQGRVWTLRRAGRVFDRAHNSLLRHLTRIKDDEWQRGMYYPVRWDGLFDEFMTLEKIFHYPVKHFHFHIAQLAE